MKTGTARKQRRSSKHLPGRRSSSGLSGKLKWAAVLIVAAAGIFWGYGYLKTQNVKPVPMLEVQYQPEQGKGVVNIKVSDVFLGFGMITGMQAAGSPAAKDGFTGSVSFEMQKQEPGTQIRVDRIRFIEQIPNGKGRVLEPARVYDKEMRDGKAPRVRFLKSEGGLPFVWHSGNEDYVFFTFSNIPADITRGELVITYNGLFPGKKYPVYYETKLPFTRKAYPR